MHLKSWGMAKNQILIDHWKMVGENKKVWNKWKRVIFLSRSQSYPSELFQSTKNLFLSIKLDFFFIKKIEPENNTSRPLPTLNHQSVYHIWFLCTVWHGLNREYNSVVVVVWFLNYLSMMTCTKTGSMAFL
jgi:hypothetical protein